MLDDGNAARTGCGGRWIADAAAGGGGVGAVVGDAAEVDLDRRLQRVMARGGGRGAGRHRKFHVGIVQLEDRLVDCFGALGSGFLERLKFVGNLVATTAGRSRGRGSPRLGTGCRRRRKGRQYVDLERNR